uniref:ribosomal protein S17 n=1 Tax=Galdieria phlegrea TaxID=1389228 RepID=UPI0023D7CC15|nr:ribosomal protein S17 [Galdieria phlegrea]UNJ16225.1 ribosomal protein S17 [Galdieria sp.]WDA99723.1 ribosomal protein S17 [Galdieria sulphuraria]WDA99915.1 ribosomal protein S17 [Galdieria phlegrea]
MSVKKQIGDVISDKMNKTIVVAVNKTTIHNKYNKTVIRTKKYKAHDENNACKRGDKVIIEETRPLSKTKRWKLVNIIRSSSKLRQFKG